MKDFVLTEETAKIPLGEFLRGADEEISVRDESGEVIARITPEEAADVVSLSEEDLKIVRRRRRSDRQGDVTTHELNAYLRSLAPERRS